MTTPLKLFIWTNFNPDYYSGLAFAIAKDVKEARKLVLKNREKHNNSVEPNWGTVSVYSLHHKIARSVSGGG